MAGPVRSLPWPREGGGEDLAAPGTCARPFRRAICPHSVPRGPTLPPCRPWEPGAGSGCTARDAEPAEVRLGRGPRRAPTADNTKAPCGRRGAGSDPAANPPGLGLRPTRLQGRAGPDGPRPAFWAAGGATAPLPSLHPLRAPLRVRLGWEEAGQGPRGPCGDKRPAARCGAGAGLRGRSGGLRKRARPVAVGGLGSAREGDSAQPRLLGRSLISGVKYFGGISIF